MRKVIGKSIFGFKKMLLTAWPVHIFIHMVAVKFETACQVGWLGASSCLASGHWQAGGAGCSDRCIDLTAAAATSLFNPLPPR